MKKIELSNSERILIKLLKGHFNEDPKYKDRTTWIETLKPWYEEFYGVDPEVHQNAFRNSMFNILYNLHSKIAEKCHYKRELREVFEDTFESNVVQRLKGIEITPIERAISRLCGLIQCNTVVETLKTRTGKFRKVKRYDLEEVVEL